ncbi:MAG TPA: sensor histidine kinase [Chitinophaga sp.]
MVNYKFIIQNRIVVILLQIAAWACFFFFPFFIYRIQVQDSSFFFKELINALFLIGLFYLNIYVFIPRFLARKHLPRYIGMVLLMVGGIIVQQAIVEYIFFKNVTNKPRLIGLSYDHAAGGVTSGGRGPFLHYGDAQPPVPQSLVGDSFYAPPSFLERSLRDSLYSNGMAEQRHFFSGNVFLVEVLRKSGLFALLMLFMSGFIKIAIEWFNTEKQNEALKVAQLNAELRFLKSQINPHFLFNTLNTIYSLAHKKSEQTEDAILKLSGIMRYVIYLSNENRVPLINEMQYLDNYIEIQKLRLLRDIRIDYCVEGDPEGLLIEPMMLIPFVENAFKHGISYAEPSFISINLNILGDEMHLQVSNSLFKQRVAERGGIGLANVVKRLELGYTGAHQLYVGEQEDKFIIDLKIVLKHDTMYSGG